jgi:hypothetical protein
MEDTGIFYGHLTIIGRLVYFMALWYIL